MTNTVLQPVLGQSSNLCLSCHDGTVAPGQTTPYGAIRMRGAMSAVDVFGQDLSSVHPFNFKLPLLATSSVLPSVTTVPGKTANAAVQLIGGNVQCNSCHNPHVQGIDASNTFLVMDNTNSALCLACHTSTPSTPVLMAKKTVSVTAATAATATTTSSTPAVSPRTGNVVKSSYNGLTAWNNSAHDQTGYQVSTKANAGPYGTMRKNACLSCHAPHQGKAGASLLSASKQPAPNMDATTQNCMNCHNGGSMISPAIMNIYQEFTKKAHPFPAGSNSHVSSESTVLNKNRHATCVDCHEPHAAQKTVSFASTALRPSQNGASGISATDGVTVVSPAVNQFETCLRCHGASSGKQVLPVFGYLPTRMLATGDRLNLTSALSVNTISSHPVSHDRQSSLPQPSLLKFMWNLDGHTQGRIMGNRLLCTDCHNSDDNREFGGTGPNGPHGSQYGHILERQYETSQVVPGVPPVAGPGTTVQNLLPAITDPAANGPYSLCAKCHDLSNVLSNASFKKHSTHINAGFSCSVCHEAHGISTPGTGLSGERLVNFDIAVVAMNDAALTPIAYNRASGTCTLKCHNYNHNQNGTVTLSQAGKIAPTAKH
jgi:predicted CXXCH cytochrome family protein